MLEKDVIARIRRIFLQVRPHVSIRQATDLLGWTRERMAAAIAAGEVVLSSTPLGKWVGREDLIAKGLEAWSLDVIEAALGDDAARVLPDALRTAELRVRLPRFQVEMLQYFARQEATTVSGVLSASSTAWPAPTLRNCRRRYPGSPRR